MQGRIPESFISNLINTSNIVDVITKYVPDLKKKGSNFLGCCPFHNEKTPSFTVNQDKQIYHCFGCKAGGNIITFLKEINSLDYIECIQELADIQNLTIPYEKTSNQDEYQISYEINKKTAKLYRWQLKNNIKSNIVINYLKNRKISSQTAKDFLIGYAPDSWNTIVNIFGNNYSTEILKNLGLLSLNSKKTNYFDFFRDRVIFPIRNQRGQVIAFGGRIIDEDKSPKYLNSPDTLIFKKSYELYGLYELKLIHNKNIPYILVVEGYMDVVGLWQYGFKYSVASLGTSFSEHHIQTLFRLTNKVILCFDGDIAGRKASLKALEISFAYQNDEKTLHFLNLPDKYDPDSYIQEYGLDSFNNIIEKKQNLDDYLIKTLHKLYDNNNGKILHHIKDIIIKAPNSIMAIKLENILSTKLNMTEMQRDNLFRKSIEHESNLHDFNSIETLQYQDNITEDNYIDNHNIITKCLSILLRFPNLLENVNLKTIYEDKDSEYLLYIFKLKNTTQSKNIVKAIAIKFPEKISYFNLLIKNINNYKIKVATQDTDNTQIYSQEFWKLELKDKIRGIKQKQALDKIKSLTYKSEYQSLTNIEKDILMNLILAYHKI